MRLPLIFVLACAAIAGATPAQAAENQPARDGSARRPNVLVICADDHAPYVIGAYGNRTVRTPNIDRLLAGGIRFDRAYCNSPVCTASRQSFLTGRYPRTIGVTRLETPLSASELTLAERFASAGYDTAAIGKMHFNSDLAHGFRHRLDLADHRKWLPAQPAREPAAGVEVQPPWRPFKDAAAVWLNAACRPIGLADEQMDGTWFARQAVEYLAERRDGPFFLMVSFYEPHSPFRFPREFRERHQAAEFSVPKPGPQDDAQIPAVFRDLTGAEKQGIAAAYYTSVEFLDKNVGLVLAALERAGHADDTVVVYLSDHGYFLGQHGRFEKHASFEEAVRAPLAIRYPPRIEAGRATDALVELVDLAPTLVELAGVERSAGLQGRSLVALAEGKTTRHREHVIVEYAPNEEAMIRDERWKLIYERGVERRTDGYDTGRPLVRNHFRLYDLEHDPAELHNLADERAHADTRARLTRLLVEHLVATAREPELLPKTSDPLAILEFAVQSRDVPRK
ncbi:MAG TPA: sulfatase-like hydrolase/transferase [Pirellulales bacterium]|nr:sulfatase-like hydrolase/transferase [Pirellulales bacterium]